MLDFLELSGTMATSTKIQVTPEMHGEYSVAHLAEASAKTTSEILQENHEKHDIVFNDFGLHSESNPGHTKSHHTTGIDILDQMI